MNRSRRLAIPVLVASALETLLVTSPSIAAKPPSESQAAVRQILPREAEASITWGDRRISMETGAPLALYRVGYRVTPGTAEAMATEYLRDNARLLYLAEDLADLEHDSTLHGPAGRTVRFRQHVDGVPVYRGEIAVTISHEATVSFVMNGYEPNAMLASTAPSLSASQARQVALDYLMVVGGLRFEHTRLVVFHHRGKSHLAYQVRMVPRESPLGDWEALVDAHNGEILKVADNALYVDVGASIFEPDPLSSAGAFYGAPGFSDGGDLDTTELTGQLVDALMRGIDFSGSTYHLVGPYAEIRDFESPYDGLFEQSSPAFEFTRSQDGFEAANTYYHIDNMMRYLDETLGLSIMPFQYAGGVRFDPHGLGGSDNSHYLPSTGELAFGEGGVDDAEDADVIIHELGHALHDWVTAGNLSQVEGLSEGCGDYVAASYSRSLHQWTPVDPQYQWVFDWDGHNPFWGGRVTDYSAHYPEGLVGQIHTDGQIWSTCLMRIWDAIGREPTDQAFLAGLAMTGSRANQEDAAQAVLQAAVDMRYPGTSINAMESIFRSCGYDVWAQCDATCGNDAVQCSEVCDGTDLGLITCNDFGCAGGTLTCNATCDGFDTSACTSCPACDADGVCELGEACDSCPEDCASGTTSGAVCGNGLCEAGDGESCVNCARDCNGTHTGKPVSRFCCGDGSGENPVPCSDSRCTDDDSECTDVPSEPGGFCCGLFGCENGESCGNCALDCATGAELCGDGMDNDCDGGFDCEDSDCLGDPGCSCGQPGDSCEHDSDCCSSKCRGKTGSRTCR